MTRTNYPYYNIQLILYHFTEYIPPLSSISLSHILTSAFAITLHLPEINIAEDNLNIEKQIQHKAFKSYTRPLNKTKSKSVAIHQGHRNINLFIFKRHHNAVWLMAILQATKDRISFSFPSRIFFPWTIYFCLFYIF